MIAELFALLWILTLVVTCFLWFLSKQLVDQRRKLDAWGDTMIRALVDAEMEIADLKQRLKDSPSGDNGA